MNLLWDLYWPVIVAAAVAGVIAGAFGFRRKKGRAALAAGLGAVVAIAWAWQGPGGAGGRFADAAEKQTRQVLVDFEMAPVRAIVERSPLSRTLVLNGPADDFQRSELVRILNDVRGIGAVHWVDQPAPFMLPLIVEVELAALISFGLGLLMAYLLELRRRSNAQWSW